MPELTADIEGLQELRARFANSPMVMREAAHDTLEVATFVAEGAAKEAAPIDKGILRGAIDSVIHNEGMETVAVVGTNIEYAPYQEFGTGIYGPTGTPITPKRGKFLVFQSKGGGLVFARSVSGSRPRRFMAKGLQAVRSNMGKINDAAIQAVKKKLRF